MDQSQLDSLYQQYLGRGVDPNGAANWANADYNTVVQGILGSQEYQNRQQQPQAQPQQQQQQPQPAQPSYDSSNYNFAMTGKPDDSQLSADPSLRAAWENYSGTSSAPAATTPPNWLRPEDYVANGYAAPYSQQQLTSAVDPNSIRQGAGNVSYAGLTGNSSYFDPTSAGEYVVDPKTNKFILDKNGNPIAVPRPNDPNHFGDFVADTGIPVGIAIMAAMTGAGAAGLLGAGTDAALMGPTYGELGYTGLEAGAMGPTYAELGYTGINGAADIAAADAAAASALSEAGLSASTLSSLLKGGASLASIAKSLGTGSSGAKTSATGTNPLATALKNLATPVTQTGTGFNLAKGNVNPFVYTKDMATQTLAPSKADPFAALNVAQTPITPYNPLAHIVG